MKKIFRMALVFALAGATLLYTGCTKDYEEEIGNLDKALSSLSSDYSQTVSNLQSEISSLKSSLSSLESAYKAADAALQKAIDANAKDIKALQGAVDDVKASISSLESKVKANEDAIAQLQKDLELYATKEELANAKSDLEGQIKKEKEALEQKIADEKKALEDAIAGVKSELLAKAEALGKDIEALKTSLTADEAKIKANADAIAELQKADKEIKDIFAALSNELRSLVFIPDLYYAGIEAVEYAYAMISVYDLVPQWEAAEFKDQAEAEKASKAKVITADTYFYNDDLKTWEIVDVTMPWGQIVDSYPAVIQIDVDKKGKPVFDQYVYSIGQQGVANYNLNPSSFDPANAEWTLVGADYDYVVRADEELPEPREATWEPVLVDVANNAGDLAVTFDVKNPERLSGLVESYYMSVMEYLYASNKSEGSDIAFSTREDSGIADALANCAGTVSIINLVADLGDKTIESDYEAILAAPQYFAHLAFASDTKCYTSIVPCYSIDPKNSRVLYNRAWNAIQDAYSVDVLYNGGDLDLAKYINIHTAAGLYADVEDELTLEELNKLYGDRFHYEFNMVEYTIGDNLTPENAYATITKDGMLTPMYVISNVEDGTWKSAPIAKGDQTGVSSVGRYPVVQVTLYDGENVLLNGFFKCKIVKAARQADNIEIVLPNLGEVPYLCIGTDVASNWHQFSSLVLEKVGMDYNEFIGYYFPDNYDDAEMTVYVKNEKGEYVKLVDTIKDAKTKEKYPNDFFGTVEYCYDEKGSGINDAFVWTVNAMNIGAGKTATIYVHMAASQYENLWIELTASVAAKAGTTFGIKNPAYWFDDIDDEVEINTARANVLVPTVTEDDVTYFVKALDDYFVGNKLQVVFDEESAAYAKIKNASTEIEYTYQFSKVQPKVGDYQLVTNEDQDIIYCASVNDKGAIIKYEKKEGQTPDATEAYVLPTAADAAVAQIIYTEGQKDSLKYFCAEPAKTLLNLWGKEETDNAKILYCNIDVIASYGDCHIAAGDMSFHVRFIRPVSAKSNDKGTLSDAIPGGDEVLLGNLLGAVDWQGFEIFKYVAEVKDKSGKVTTKEHFEPGTYVTVSNDTINWFEYYGFETMTINFGKVQTNQTGEWKPVYGEKGVNQSLILDLYCEGEKVETTDGVATADLSEEVTLKEIPALLKYTIRYKNNMGVVSDFALRIPVEIEYAWGTLEYIAEIPVSRTY